MPYIDLEKTIQTIVDTESHVAKSTNDAVILSKLATRQLEIIDTIYTLPIADVVSTELYSEAYSEGYKEGFQRAAVLYGLEEMIKQLKEDTDGSDNIENNCNP